MQKLSNAIKEAATHYKSGFAYSSCGLFSENIDLIQKFRETGSSKYIYRNK